MPDKGLPPAPGNTISGEILTQGFSPDEERLGELLVEWEDRLERGADVPAAELCRGCEQLVDALQERIVKAKALRAIAGGEGEPQPPVEAFKGVRYRPVRYHAGGGLGDVFVAWDEEAGREVVLKRIKAERAELGESRERFCREAEITSRLEHPGIVPVYGLGRDGNGQPFYAMRFIRGESLAEAIDAHHRQYKEPRENPNERGVALRQLVNRLLAACNAVAYAHSRGVIHRDLKPANIMLGKYGETLVLDWGLARTVERAEPYRNPAEETVQPPTGGSDSGTQMGMAFGTPAYMSPEQANGWWDVVGPASDVFSLGATLYVLLTGQPPYSGARAFQDAREGKYLSPGRLRPDVPPALEGVCLKAMARAPEGRYATTQEMADDLERWLNDVPVGAYRESITERAARWVKRNRTTVASTIVALVVALVVGGGAWGWRIRDRAERLAEQARKTRDRHGKLMAELDRAAQLRQRARKAPREEWGRLTVDALAVAEQANRFLEPGEEYLTGRAEQLLASLREEDKDRRMLNRLDEARLSRTAIKQNEYDWSATDAEYARAFADYGIDLQALTPEDAIRRMRGRSIRAELAAALDDWAESKKDKKDSDRLRALARRVDDDAVQGRIREASFRKDPGTLKRMAEASKRIPLTGSTAVLLATALRNQQLHDEAEGVLQGAWLRSSRDFWLNHELGWLATKRKQPRLNDALRFYTVAVSIRPRSPGAWFNVGWTLGEMKRFEEAVQAHRKAIEYAPNYAKPYNNLGWALNEKGQYDEAIPVLKRAIELDPRNAMAHNTLGYSLNKKERYDEAIPLLGKAIKFGPKLANAHANLGWALVGKGRHDDAIKSLRKAIELDPKGVQAYRTLGISFVLKLDYDRAIPILEKAIQLDPKEVPVYLLLGLTFVRKKDYDRAISVFTKAIELDPKNASAHANLGHVLNEKGRHDEAIPVLNKAVELDPKNVMAHTSLGWALIGKGRHDEAIPLLKKAIELDPKEFWAYNNLGLAFNQKKRYDQAIPLLKQAIELDQTIAKPYHNLGDAYAGKGRWEEAISAYREATLLQPDNAVFHTDLLKALLRRDRFQEAFLVHEEFHKSLKPEDTRRENSGAILLLVQRLLRMKEKIPALLADKAKPSEEELRPLAELCEAKQLLAAAARFWNAALEADPKLAADLRASYRYNAACLAARVASGQGEDAPKAGSGERSRWRGQALRWLRADLAAWTKRLDQNPKLARPELLQTLRHWRTDPDLSGVRDKGLLARLPAGQRVAWQALWIDVEALLKLAREPEAGLKYRQ